METGACEMQQVPPATRPAAAISRPRSSPSLLHDSPVSSMEGRGQCDPRFSPPTPFFLLWELYRATRGFPPRPKPFSPPLPPTAATLERVGVTCACPSRLPTTRSKLLRACGGTTPPNPPFGNARPPAPWPTGLQETRVRLAPEPPGWSSGGKEGG